MFAGLLGNASKVDNNNLSNEFDWLLAAGENFQIGFVLIRDLFIFSNMRLILIDKQGFSGKKMEIMSIPYTKISRFSIENAGSFDMDSELKIWIQGENLPISKSFRKDINIREIYRILSDYII
jgi:Bacterial PH domain